jgi:outer membrane immunogenic protein
MRTKLWSGIGVLASIAASVGAAGAADLAVKAPVYKAPPPPIILSDWAGLYLGINGGGGWGHANLNQSIGSTTLTGGLIGGHAGYNWQFGSVVVGVEGDADAAFLSKSVPVIAVNAAGAGVATTVTEKNDMLASVRGRLGYVIAPQVLAYGTGGVGFGHFKVADTVGDAFSTDQLGWVAGGGLEYKFWGPWIGRVEYLHYGFDTKTLPLPAGPVKESVDSVRAGVSYKF